MHYELINMILNLIKSSWVVNIGLVGSYVVWAIIQHLDDNAVDDGDEGKQMIM